MPTHSFIDIIRQLQSTGLRDFSGSRISGTVPVSERLINEIVASAIRPGGPVREVRVRPLAGDAFEVRVSPRAAVLPSLTLRVEIDRQPEIPGSAVLVLRMATMGGLLGLAGAALPIASLLPPGVRLDGDKILLDLRALSAQRRAEDLLRQITQLRVNTDAGRVVLHIDLAVD